MYNELLVPLDGSKLSESILPYVKCLAEALKLPVRLLQAKDPQPFCEPSQQDDYLKNIADSMLASFPVRYTVEIGKPGEIIINAAARDPGTLIAMVTQGRSEIRRRLFGSVANKVVLATLNSLVLMRAMQERQSSDSVQLRKIVVPLDGSSVAEKILPHVIEMAKALKSEVILVRECSMPWGTNAFAKRFYVPYTDQLAASVEREARTYLEAKVQELRAQSLGSVSYQLMDGAGTGEITELALKNPDNMLAIYRPSNSEARGLAIRKLMKRIMRRWESPVLIVRE